MAEDRSTDRGPGRVPFVLMRGGTSKCHFFRVEELPRDQAERDRLLLAAYGSPDPRQIDGVGGATSTTSKAMIVSPPSRPDVHVDFTFAQVSVTKPIVDYGGTCGNCSSAVGPYAVDEGLVDEVVEPTTVVRGFNTNTGKVLAAEVPVRDGRAEVEGTYRIAGVPRSGAPIKMWFEDPGGAVTGKLLPTGRASDIVDLPGLAGVPFSLVDAVNPVVFVRAGDLGARGTELPEEIEADAQLLQRLEGVRGHAAALMGLVDDPAQARERTPGIPKIAMVAEPHAYRTIYGDEVDAASVDLVARIMSMGTAHQAYALSGALCTAVAATVPGTVVHDHAVPRDDGAEFRLGHPSGTMSLDVDAVVRNGEPVVRGVAGYRTARRIADGHLYV